MFKKFTLYISFFLICISNFLLPSNVSIECSICESKINEQKYLVDIWGNPFHIHHKNKGQFCECCSRIISQKITGGGYILNDGRHICSLCDISIITEAKVQKSLKYIVNILSQNGVQGLNLNEIDIFLVNKDEMKKLYGFNASDHLKGLTKISIKDNKIFKIYILNNIPEIQFQAILAHELLHVWLYKNSINLDYDKMEAFCNLGSYLIYKNDGTKFSNIHLISFEKSETRKKQTEIYNLLKAITERNSFNYLLKNIKTIDIQ
tara:strand:- start:2548 stop:3336 length:789 start_codon:yes stop_codon:yes gene_type:complete